MKSYYQSSSNASASPASNTELLKWLLMEKKSTILEMIRSSTLKHSYQKILNRHSNLHLGFVGVFFFWFGWFLWGCGWGCISRDCTEHKYTWNLLLKASILSVLEHSKTFSLGLKIPTFTNISWGQVDKSTTAEILMKYAADPTWHHNSTEKKCLIIGFISHH